MNTIDNSLGKKGLLDPRLLEFATFSRRKHIALPEDFLVLLNGVSIELRETVISYIAEKIIPSQEFPEIYPTSEVPTRLITLSEALRWNYSGPTDCWVCCYENDKALERLKNHLIDIVPKLKRFKGLITPDFSIGTAESRAVQITNTLFSRIVGSYAQQQGIPVIASVRYSGMVSRDFCCEGVPENSTIAVGALGCMKDCIKREIFFEGIDFSAKMTSPKNIVVCGSTDRAAFAKYERMGINMLLFPSPTREAKDKWSMDKKASREQISILRQEEFT
jgi:hypothetical protein